MCGIVGLYLKDQSLWPQLGQYFSPMLIEMTERGPDSAGFAIYREGSEPSGKISVFDPKDGRDWNALASEMASALDTVIHHHLVSNHTVFSGDLSASAMRQWIDETYPDLRVMSAGNSLEIYKDIGLPKDVIDRFSVAEMQGSHMIGHTRMATESAVTTEGAHPFNTGEDLCLVHNGSLSNHNVLKRKLIHDHGLSFQTENDSEVAAGYLSWRLSEGASLEEALHAALKDLDGFFTFTVGTKDGFAVLRDPVACKPAVLAETDEWVAMASEFRAFAGLPGIEKAKVWEPAPATVYTWGHA